MSLYGDIWFSDPDGETVSAAWTSEWLNVESVLDFGIFVSIGNTNLVGEVYVEASDDDGSGIVESKLVWADGDDHEDIASGVDLEHMFDVIGCAAPWVRVGIAWTSGASTALGVKAKIYRKRARSR